jgi:F-type H+-transporting ATPase subunit alpha
VREALRQRQFQPLPVSHQVVILYAAGQGYLDDLSIDQVLAFESYLIAYMNAHHAALMDRLERGRWTRQVREQVPEAVAAAKQAFLTRQAEE